ncbi:MAG: hypothetical protein CL878_01420 [Dehalococcoidia bacterium]|nr:hypothetical protein [Dehalococcoidia bacterium]
MLRIDPAEAQGASSTLLDYPMAFLVGSVQVGPIGVGLPALTRCLEATGKIRDVQPLGPSQAALPIVGAFPPAAGVKPDQSQVWTWQSMIGMAQVDPLLRGQRK